MTEEDYKIDPNVCYCQCEGAYASAWGICPVHPPKTHEEMRKIVEQFYKSGYEDGILDARDKIQDLATEILKKI